MFQRRTWGRQKFGSIFRDVEIVFETNAKFSRNVDARLITEDHACLQLRIGRPAEHVVLDQVGPLVALQAIHDLPGE